MNLEAKTDDLSGDLLDEADRCGYGELFGGETQWDATVAYLNDHGVAQTSGEKKINFFAQSCCTENFTAYYAPPMQGAFDQFEPRKDRAVTHFFNV